MRTSNLTFHHGTVSRSDRERILGQRGCTIWFTGLSGSGKSTIAHALAEELIGLRKLAYVLDGDNLRHGLNANLGFTDADRHENVRRAAEVAALFADAGLIAIVALISPFRADREHARNATGTDLFLEVFVDTPLEICEARDPKGLYKRARSGEIPHFTGISSAYEAPEQPTVTISHTTPLDRAVVSVIEVLRIRGFLGEPSPLAS